jgi:hypothetical protein
MYYDIMTDGTQEFAIKRKSWAIEVKAAGDLGRFHTRNMRLQEW